MTLSRYSSSSAQPVLAAAPASVSADPRAGETAAVQVLAVIVCHEPQLEGLYGLVEKLCTTPKVSVVLVDNSEAQTGVETVAAVALDRNVELVQNGRNLGVAQAQNIGIARARSTGCTHVLLLDQDSALDGVNVERMLAAFWLLRLSGRKIAALGPSVVDPETMLPMDFVRLGRLRMKRLARTNEPVSCDMLISSGCLIAMDALAQVGPMDDGLFIDYVDMEWCTRARSTGYEVVGLPDVTMLHRLGECSMRVAGREVSVHTPTRSYYLVRNALLFARKAHLSWRWRAHLVYRAAGHVALFSMLLPNRVERTKWMLLGGWHGLIGRSGRLGGQDGLGRARRQELAHSARN
jgi:rhamnosyltransferase